MAPLIATSDLTVTTALRKRIAESCARDLSKAFAAWLLEDFNHPDLRSIAARAAKWQGADEGFQIVATLGFAADSGLLSGPELVALKNALGRLSGRSPMVDGLPRQFCADAVGILGIAVGTAVIANAEVTGQVMDWERRFLKRIYQRAHTKDWHRCLFAAADRKLGAPLNLPLPNSEAVADVRLALLAKGVITYPDTQVQQDVARVKQSRIEELLGGPIDCERAALCVAGVEWVNRQADKQADPAGASTEHISTNPPQTLKDDQQRESGKMSRLQEAQQPQDSPKVKKPVRRTRQYEQIDKALREFSAAHPRNHEEVFRFLDDRKVAIANRKPFKTVGGWRKGFQQNPHAARAWLSQAWARLGLPAFARGPKK